MDEMHPDMMAASSAAVSDGRLTQAQADYLMAFMANPQAFTLGNIFSIILPILGVILPQFAPLLAIIAQLFGGVTPSPSPTPTPTPGPTPAPGGFLAQLIAFFQSLFNGGKLPVPKPSPAPVPTPSGDIIVPTPVP